MVGGLYLNNAFYLKGGRGHGRKWQGWNFHQFQIKNFGTLWNHCCSSLSLTSHIQLSAISVYAKTCSHFSPLPGPSHHLFSKPPHPFLSSLLPLPCSRSPVLHRAARGILLKDSCQISLFCLKASSGLKIKFIYNSALAPRHLSLPADHTCPQTHPSLQASVPWFLFPGILLVLVPETHACSPVSLGALFKWKTFCREVLADLPT